MDFIDAWKTDSGYDERSSEQEELAELREENERLLKALNLCLDYFNDRSDVDCANGVWIPNDENKLLVEVAEILGDRS